MGILGPTYCYEELGMKCVVINLTLWIMNLGVLSLKSYPLAKWESMKISVLFHSCVHLTLPFWIKRIPENFSSFAGKFTLCTTMTEN